MKPPIPPTEQERLKLLRTLNLFESDNEQAFHDITRIAGELFGVPIAAISLIDENRQYFKSILGLNVTQTSRDVSFCAHTLIDPGQPLVVPDATKDDRFSDNALVTGDPGIRFYAGSPLLTSDGIPLGALCVIDRKPFTPTQQQIELLGALARQVTRLIEERRRSIQMEVALQRIQQSDDLFRAAGRLAKLGSWGLELNPPRIEWSRETKLIHEVPIDYIPDLDTAINFYAPEARSIVRDAVDRAIQHGEPFEFELPMVTAKGNQIIVRSIGKPEYHNGKCVRIAGVVQDVSSWKVAEQRAIQSEQQLQLTLNAINDGIWDWRIDSEVVNVNPRWFTMLGYPARERASFDLWKGLVHPEDIDTVIAKLEEHIQGKSDQFDCDLRMRTLQGEYVWVQTRGRIVECDSSGKPLRMVGTHTDVTSRKQAELAKREIDQRLEKVSAQLPGFLYQHRLFADGTSCLPYASEGIRQVYRVTPEQVREDASVMFKAIHPEDYARVVESIGESARTLKTWRSEFRVLFEDGSCEWLEGISSPEKLPDDSILWHGFFANVSDRVKAQQAIRQNEQRLSVALETSNIGLWDWNMAGGTACYTDCYYTMLGYMPGELPNRADSWRNLIHPEDAEATTQKLNDHIEGKESQLRVEARLRQKDGTYRWILIAGRAVEHDLRGNVLRMIGVHIDIETQKRDHAELERARAESDVANRAKSEFLANMSHEIRTPLASILGYCDVLREAKSPEEINAGVEVLERNSTHLLGLINDILDISKIEAQKMTIESMSVEVRTMVQEALAVVDARTKAAHLELRVEFEPDVPVRMQTDPTRMQQVLINLVGNAIKFTPRGCVTVRVKAPTSNEPDHLTFHVIDTGIGMNADELARLYKPFVQADKSVTRRFGGTGLGLAISHQIVTMLGGRIEVQSTPGKGTTFSVTIGSGRRSSNVSRTTRPAEPVLTTIAQASVRKVLLVDDAPDIRALMTYVLKRYGITPVVAENGLQAIAFRDQALANGEDFELILMDMQMPVMDGYSAATALRKQGFAGRIIATTASAMSDDNKKCFEAGCDGFLSKPIDRELFRRLLCDPPRRADASQPLAA